MRTLCVVTCTRAEYGSLKWLMNDIQMVEEFKLQIIAAGSHLMAEQGHTVDEIIDDGFSIDQTVDADIDTSSQESIASSMGRLADKISKAYAALKPDYIVVLGDRYELLPICSSAFIMDIPIIHISGGDVTRGAIDDGVRNAITMLASYHFPSTEDSYKNIIRMRGSKEHVWTVGVLELDELNREVPLSRDELAEDLKLDSQANWVMMTYHPETRESIDYNTIAVRNTLDVLRKLDGYQFLITFSNADYGGSQINDILIETEKNTDGKIRVVPSLGQKRYLSFLRQVKFMIGNSSSGITQAPLLGVPSVIIGNRQDGRHLCNNIIRCKSDYQEISEAVKQAINKTADGRDFLYWGDGHAAEKIVEILKKELL